MRGTAERSRAMPAARATMEFCPLSLTPCAYARGEAKPPRSDARTIFVRERRVRRENDRNVHEATMPVTLQQITSRGTSSTSNSNNHHAKRGAAPDPGTGKTSPARTRRQEADRGVRGRGRKRRVTAPVTKWRKAAGVRGNIPAADKCRPQPVTAARVRR